MMSSALATETVSGRDLRGNTTTFSTLPEVERFGSRLYSPVPGFDPEITSSRGPKQRASTEK